MDQIHNTLVLNRMGSINSICKGNIKKTMEKLLRPTMRLQKDAHLSTPSTTTLNHHISPSSTFPCNSFQASHTLH